jgi:hypothetical protein
VITKARAANATKLNLKKFDPIGPFSLAQGLDWLNVWQSSAQSSTPKRRCGEFPGPVRSGRQSGEKQDAQFVCNHSEVACRLECVRRPPCRNVIRSREPLVRQRPAPRSLHWRLYYHPTFDTRRDPRREAMIKPSWLTKFERSLTSWHAS